MSAIVGVTKSQIQLNCPECKWNTLVDMMTFYLAALHVGKFECAHCKAGYYVNVELLDPRSPTLRSVDPAEQGDGVHDMGEVAGVKLTYANGNVFATPRRPKRSAGN